jgi:SAM-dependent methyltransferase
MTWHRKEVKNLLPDAIRGFYSKIQMTKTRVLFPDTKYRSELKHWDMMWEREGGCFLNDHYERIMLAMAGEADPLFLENLIVADFGCGPRGSLCWATSARFRIGIDTLSDSYMQYNIKSHNMIFICASESAIPLPSNYVDVLFTLNAMDHVNDFKAMSRELLRILSPGGRFFGSFNLEEPPTAAEPQMLTVERIYNHILQFLDVSFIRQFPHASITEKHGSIYERFFDETSQRIHGRRFLWVRGKKPL